MFPLKTLKGMSPGTYFLQPGPPPSNPFSYELISGLTRGWG
jgi:hypothetical protein